MIKRFKFPKYLVLSGYLILVLIHFTIKDYYYLTGLVFYAFPLLGIIGIGLFCAILFTKDTKIFKILVLLILVLSVYWWNHSFHFEPEIDNTTKHQTLLFWNIAKKKDMPLPKLLKHIEAQDPLFIGLVEADYISDSIFKIYQNKLKNYNLIQPKGQKIFGSKIPITNVIHEGLNDDYFINLIILADGVNSFQILMVDLYGSPLHNKKPPFEIIYNYIDNNDIDFIIGDFNTPYESVYFREFEAKFNSLHGLNFGFTYTWPRGLPLYELDHIWISKKHKPLKLQNINYSISDHNLLIGHFKLQNQ